MGMITEAILRNIAGRTGFNLITLEKDYFLTLLLHTLKDVEGIYLKGGTALNKIFFNQLRLSEDIDFTAGQPLPDIRSGIKRLVEASSVFRKLAHDKTTPTFVRYRVPYQSFFGGESTLLIDINRKASIHLKPETHTVHNFYGLDFSVHTLNISEIIAEKIRALITRNQPRDYFDAYHILSHYPVDMDLVRKKTEEAGETFDVERVFRNAKKIYRVWDADLVPLVNKPVSFLECIKLIEQKLR